MMSDASPKGELAINGDVIDDEDEIRQLVSSFVGDNKAEKYRYDVVLRNLSVRGAGIGHQKAPTVPTGLMAFAQKFNPALYLSNRPQPSRTLIHPMSGILRGGETLIIIGKPGSGCTTFLKTLANMREEYEAVGGEVLYNGLDAVEMKSRHPGEVAYASEDDIHFHSLSVGTTLRFALNARTPVDIPNRAQRLNEDVQTLLKLFDLAHVANVPVGNDYIRGVSGGQRHRVTIAEAFCTRASVMCFDNPTRGLDSSTALRVARMLREYTIQSQCCTITSLYQASDAIANCFDKVLVLSAGRVAYFGPTNESKQYFQDLGFECSPQTSLTDFLTSMSGDPKSRHVRPDHDGRPVPLSSTDFERRFRESKYFESEPPVAPSQETSPLNGISGFQLPFYRQIYECTIRHYRIHFTDRSTWVAEAAGTIVQALMLGTLFRDQQAVTQGIYTRSSAIFFCVLIMCLQATAEFGNTFAQRPILLKQRALCFYRPGAYALGQILADIPWKAIFILYSLPIYWMVNLKQEAGPFFIWFLTLYVALIGMGVMFRTIAVFTTTPTRAVLPVGILMNSLIIYTGFYINPPGMKVWLGWLRYLSPMYYGFESLMLNEFVSSGYQCSEQDTVPRGASYNDTAFQVCAVQSSTPGDLVLSGQRYLEVVYTFFRSDLWRNVGINAAFFGFFAICVTIGMERFKTPAGRLSTIFYSTDIPHKSSEDTSSGSDEEKPPVNDMDNNEIVPQEVHSTSHGTMKSSQRHFAWKDLCLDIQVKGEHRRLLSNVSGWLVPGTMTALMGMSGAGKTTLLDTLAQRVSIGVVTGGLYLDSDPLPQSTNRRSGFVQQQDVHLSTSTVREALRLTARLRQPASVPISEKYDCVETVISMLEMGDVANALIGTPGAGLSLEKRKRVSIGVELAAKPDILLFLDEPTSGLDGDSAFSIISLMRKLADAGQTILCTIHQPSFELVEQFDSLLLLIPGGKTAYFGPMGPKCRTLVDYFGRYTRSCKETQNPADYVLDLTANASVDWASTWLQSPEYQATQKRLNEIVSGGASSSEKEDRQDGHEGMVYAASIPEQLRVVLGRAFLNYWRDPDYVIGKMQLNVWMGLINGLSFLQLSNSMTDSRNHMFSIFVGIITGPVLTLQIEPRFITFRDQFLAREKESRVYHWSVFVVSAFLVEIPFTMVGGLLYWLLWYYMAGFFYSSERAGYAFLMYELYHIFVASVSQLISSVFPTIGAAQIATGFVWLMVNTFNGPLSPPPLTPRGWRWFYNVSPLFYFVEGIATNAMHGLEIRCTESEISVFNVPDNQTCAEYAASFFNSSLSQGYLVDGGATGSCAYCPFANGDEYVKQYDFDYNNRARNVGIFIGFTLFNYTVVALMTYLIFIHKWKIPKKSVGKK
ncbi:ATP-binding cassette transporter [Hypoxylon trugodes]|uniref:ATP-binding cassette transporter n=1 Tax=Hypoxylon trugodes TaxID=326681 RepID=UPI002196C59B|nr:ATP-binding cassette transporter [Hypoxylon trugodes]KAI1387801.1 ATP-binding cassette transporter [Hypoxylon trugodes]